MNRQVKVVPTVRQLELEKEHFKAQKITKDLVIKHISNDLNKINLKHAINSKIYMYSLLCFISVIIGILILLFGLGKTVLFDNFKPNAIYVGISSIFFIPVLIWIKVYFLPGKVEQFNRLISRNFKKKTQKINLKKRAIQKGLNPHEITVEDEYKPEDSNEPQRIKFLKYSNNRGNVYTANNNNNNDNGLTNDFYYKYFLYPEIYNNKNNLNNNDINEIDEDIEKNIQNKMKTSLKLQKLKKKEKDIEKSKKIDEKRNFKIMLLKSSSNLSNQEDSKDNNNNNINSENLGNLGPKVNKTKFNTNVRYIDQDFLTDDNVYNRVVWGGTMEKYDGIRKYTVNK